MTRLYNKFIKKSLENIKHDSRKNSFGMEDYWNRTKVSLLIEEIVEAYSKYNKTTKLTKKQLAEIEGHYCDAPVYFRLYTEQYNIVNKSREGHEEARVAVGKLFKHREEVLQLLREVLTPYNDKLMYGDIGSEGYETGCKCTSSDNDYQTHIGLTEDGTIFR